MLFTAFFTVNSLHNYRMSYTLLSMYIYENPKWPRFRYDLYKLSPILESCHIEQGSLLAQISLLSSKETESLVMKSSSEMINDATLNFSNEITEERLFAWHASLFPTGYSGINKIDVAKYRSYEMQVISGGQEEKKILFESPKALTVPSEMKTFLTWINAPHGDSFINAAISYLWFVTVHPFEDGNERIAHAISDMMICRSNKNSNRFFSAVDVITKERKSYFSELAQAQHGSLDISVWIEWYLNCIKTSLLECSKKASDLLQKYKFLRSMADFSLNKRQTFMINKLVDSSWSEILNTSKWAKLANCSTDTALRDITDLVKKDILSKVPNENGRSTNYVLKK